MKLLKYLGWIAGDWTCQQGEEGMSIPARRMWGHSLCGRQKKIKIGGAKLQQLRLQLNWKNMPILRIIPPIKGGQQSQTKAPTDRKSQGQMVAAVAKNIGDKSTALVEKVVPISLTDPC